MDVRCEKCDTVYQFEDERVGETGALVQCKRCGHRFRVRRRPAVVTREMAGLQGVSAQLSTATPPSQDWPKDKPKERLWALRLRRTQEVMRFRDLGVLRQWILDKRVSREDDISRGGAAWRRLGSIVELEALFHSAEQADRARLQTGVGRSGVSGRLPSQGTPLQQEPRRLRSDTPGLGVGPVLSPPQRAALLEPDKSDVPTIIGPGGAVPQRVEEGAPGAAMRLSSTGRTMRPRLRQPSPVSQAPAQAAPGRGPASPPRAAPPSSARGPAPPPRSTPQEVVTRGPALGGKAAPAPRAAPAKAAPGRRPAPEAKVIPVAAPAAPPPANAAPAPSRPVAPAPAGPEPRPSQAPASATVEPRPSQVPARERRAPEVRFDEPSGPVVTFPVIEEVIRRSDPVPQFLKEPLGQEGAPAPAGEPPSAAPEVAEAATASDDGEDSWEEEFYFPRQRNRAWLGAVAALVAACALGGAYLVVRQPPRGAAAGGSKARSTAAYEAGLRFFLADTDEDFQRAHDQFLRAAGADESDAAPLAALAELHACWALALGEDLRRAEPAQAELLKREAERHVQQARHYANQALALDASSPAANRAMALTLVESGATEAQVDVYLKQASRSDGPELAFVRARLSQRERRPDEARAWLDKALAAQPALLRALRLRGVLETEAGDRAAAVRAYAQLRGLSPQHRRAQEALAGLGRAASADPPRTPAPPARVEPPLRTPALPTPAAASAEAPERPAESPEPRDYGARLQRAQRLLDRGRPREAQRLLVQLADERPDDPDVHVGLGACATDMERYQAAVGHFQDALRLHADYPLALIGLAEAYKLRGDVEQALRWYRRYLEKTPDGEQAQLARNNVSRLEAQVESPPPRPVPAEAPAPVTPPPSAP